MIIKLSNKSFSKTLSDISADKSVSHRVALFSLLASGPSKVRNYLMTGDCISTLNFIKSLGASVEILDDNQMLIYPPEKIISPSYVLDCGNAGTLMRLAIGLLSCLEGSFVLSGDEYLNARPMRRVSKPLNEVGAQIFGRDDANFAPIYIKGSKLEFFKLTNHNNSAQVKSAAILAGLLSQGCEITEIESTREHSEDLLRKMGAQIEIKDNIITVKPLQNNNLKPLDITVGNDPSSAFFFAVLCAIVPNSYLKLNNVLLNKTRIQAFLVLEQMGVKLHITANKDDASLGCIELHSPNELRSVTVDDKISWLIDEIPALCIAMAHANGNSVVKNAAELRVKECDRINAIVHNLKSCSIKVEEFSDGFAIEGGIKSTKLAQIKSFGDHRIAMSFALMGVSMPVEIDDVKCVKVSFAKFFDILKDFENES